MSIETIIKKCNSLLEEKFDLKIEKTKLNLYPKEEWQKFIESKNLTGKCEEVYLPASYSANILKDSKFILLNIFHCYFGHGLFCENTPLGRKLVNATKQGELEDKFLYEYVADDGLPFMQAIANYEGFALWIEGWLSNLTGHKELWEERLKTIRIPFLSFLKRYENIEEEFGSYGVIYKQGFFRQVLKKIIIDPLKEKEPEIINNTKYIFRVKKKQTDKVYIITSSAKRYKIPTRLFKTTYLDYKEFNYYCDNLNPIATDIIKNGELIYGNKREVEILKEKLHTTIENMFGYYFDRAAESIDELFEDGADIEECLERYEKYFNKAWKLCKDIEE